jgi:hypothetical protein
MGIPEKIETGFDISKANAISLFDWILASNKRAKIHASFLQSAEKICRISL